MTSQPHAPTVGGYTLLTKIGEGGMGVVHLARRGDGPRVALKVLRPHIVGDDEARQRLAREVSSLGRIRSRWVAEILDADPWAPVPYVATRYVPGLSLHDHVQHHGPIEGDDLIWFAGCLAEGLASVHDVGVLHRDVKPSNVLMEGRTPILIDFGLARVADDPRLTHTGWLLGTPGYLAPEILYGEDASAASDLHSWAATVAFAGIGGAPFGRGPSMAIMDRVRRGEHDLTGLTGPLHDVVVAALDPEPSRRPTLQQVLDWLRPQTTVPTPLLGAPPSRPAPHAAPTVGPVVSPVIAPRSMSDTAERPAVIDPFDAPLALAALAHGDQPVHDDRPDHDDVDVDVDVDDSAARVTEVLPEERPGPAAPAAPPPFRPAAPTLVERVAAPVAPPVHLAPQPVAAPYDPWGPQPLPPPVPVGERARRLALVGAGAVLTGAACALAPWVTLAVVVLVVWLLRSASLAASAVEARRSVRGRRWYDAPQLLVHAPWHLVQSIGGAAMLLCWAGGLGIAVALVCYAVAATIPVSLFVTGFVMALSLWWGPGGSRLRGPLGRVVDPLSRRVGPWVGAVVVVLGLALLGGAWVEASGPSWTPGQDQPFSTR